MESNGTKIATPATVPMGKLCAQRYVLNKLNVEVLKNEVFMMAQVHDVSVY